MNEIMERGTGSALVLPEAKSLATMFSDTGDIEKLIKRIEYEARSHAPDLSTAKGRDAIKSLAFKVTKSKTALDEAGKSLNEERRAAINAVDAVRRIVRDRLDALRDEVRKPLDDWEADEEARVVALKTRLERLRTAHDALPVDASSEQIGALLARVEAAVIDDTWAEYAVEAGLYRDQAIATIKHMHAAAVAREEAAAEAARQVEELAQLRAEKAAREEADRIKAEHEAAEARRIEADKAQAERAAQIERDKQEAAKRASEEAEARAKAEAERASRDAAEREATLERQKAEAEARHAREMADAKAREEVAAQRERDRIEADRRAEEEAQRKRAENTRIRNKVKREIVAAISAVGGGADDIADALIAGRIPHIKVEM